MIDYRTLSDTKNRHYDALYWERIRVLYEGAKTLKDALHAPTKVRGEIFPMHIGEEPEAYAERIKRACYVNYFSQLVDYIISTLFSDPVKITAGGNGEDLKPGSVEPFYDDFYRNTAQPGARPVTFNETLRRLALDALLFKRAWLLIDFPAKPEGVEVNSRAAEELLEAGGQYKRAYCCHVDPECVYDWEKAEDGELAWAMIHDKAYPRPTPGASRTSCVETFTVYDRESWTRYIWEYDEEKAPPKDNDGPTRTESGKHDFGRVPLLDFKIPDGLWAGGKLENIAVELFNKLSALSWGQYRSLFQVIVVNLQSSDPKSGMDSLSEDGKRAIKQTWGPGRIMEFAERDQVRFVGPDVGPFAEARAYLAELRDEMHRVLHQMAQAVDNSGAGLKRSGESKKMDQASGAIVARELGRIFREFTVTIYDTVAAGRNEYDKVWSVSGLESYDEQGASDLVDEAVNLEKVNIPSPTWQTVRKFELANKLTPGLTDEQKTTVYNELKSNIETEQANALNPGAEFSSLMNPGGKQIADGKNDADNMDDGAAGTEAVDAVYQQLADDFEPDAIEWVKSAQWEGPTDVPVDQVDFSNSASWNASQHPAKIKKFEKKIKSGDRKPVILIKPPGGGKYRVADGHHRTLASKNVKKPVRAYIATVTKEQYAAALEMHSAQKNNPSKQ